jgi:4-nitrophenyl phosphatase
VLWHESDVVSGAIATLKQLQGRGHTLLFVTNNSGKSRSAYAEKMRQMGFDLQLTPHSVLSSSYAAAHFLSTQPSFDKAVHTAFFLGDSGIAEELSLVGIRAIDARPLIGSAPLPRSRLSTIQLDPSIQAVVVGIDDQLTYSKVSYAASLLRDTTDDAGARRLFVATNRDATLPTGPRDLPGAGACVAAVEVASGRVPVNVGKPERLMFDLGRDALKLDEAKCLMIGDRLDTDILFGAKAGMDTLMVETGINSRADVMREDNDIHPTYIISDVNALLTEQQPANG